MDYKSLILLARVSLTPIFESWRLTWVSTLNVPKAARLNYHLVPFPRLHFFTAGYAPLVANASKSYTVCPFITLLKNLSS